MQRFLLALARSLAAEAPREERQRQPLRGSGGGQPGGASGAKPSPGHAGHVGARGAAAHARGEPYRGGARRRRVGAGGVVAADWRGGGGGRRGGRGAERRGVAAAPPPAGESRERHARPPCQHGDFGGRTTPRSTRVRSRPPSLLAPRASLSPPGGCAASRGKARVSGEAHPAAAAPADSTAAQVNQGRAATRATAPAALCGVGLSCRRAQCTRSCPVCSCHTVLVVVPAGEPSAPSHGPLGSLCLPARRLVACRAGEPGAPSHAQGDGQRGGALAARVLARGACTLCLERERDLALFARRGPPPPP